MTEDREPLVVSVSRACELLSVSRDTFYRLLRAGEFRSFHDGGKRKIELRSIKKYIARQLAAEQQFPNQR